MDENSHQLEVFLDVQSGLPRQGPGEDASTLQALSVCKELPDKSMVLDIGCGPGMQTVALARALDAEILAIDINPQYLEALTQRADEAGLSGRIDVARMDMLKLPFHEQSFDLIWAEGSAYIMGFEKALRSWKKLLNPRGYIGVTELVWCRADPPGEVADFFGREYSAMTDVETNLSLIRSSGYETVAHFTLPDTAWWENYYTPLEARLALLEHRYAGDSIALEIIETTKTEIRLRRQYSEVYGYEFFIARADA